MNNELPQEPHTRRRPIRPTNPHARRLRAERTPAEEAFWLQVRDRRLGGYKFRFQSTIGPYVADFLCASEKLVVEIDGGQHTEEKDGRRTELMQARGYRVIRFWNNDVLTNMEGVLTVVLLHLDRNPAAPPLPGPLPSTLSR